MRKVCGDAVSKGSVALTQTQHSIYPQGYSEYRVKSREPADSPPECLLRASGVMCKAKAVTEASRPDLGEKIITPESGDGWTYAPDGTRYWGLYGAAGLLTVDVHRRMLLQHRVEWSHHGGTWGIPGGARHGNETAVHAALREAAEEAAVPPDSQQILFEYAVDLGFWSYTTVVTLTTEPFEAQVMDAESNELRWVALDQIEALPLHPGFAASWPEIRTRLFEHLDLIR